MQVFMSVAILGVLDGEIVEPVHIVVVKEQVNRRDDQLTSVNVHLFKREWDQLTNDVIAHVGPEECKCEIEELSVQETLSQHRVPGFTCHGQICNGREEYSEEHEQASVTKKLQSALQMLQCGCLSISME